MLPRKPAKSWRGDSTQTENEPAIFHISRRRPKPGANRPNFRPNDVTNDFPQPTVFHCCYGSSRENQNIRLGPGRARVHGGRPGWHPNDFQAGRLRPLEFISLGGADNRDFRQRIRQLVNDAVRLRILRTGFRMSRDPACEKVTVERPARRVPRVWLGIGLIGQAASDHSPVIKDARNVTNLLRSHPGDATQGEIVILRALESLAEPAYLAK